MSVLCAVCCVPKGASVRESTVGNGNWFTGASPNQLQISWTTWGRNLHYLKPHSLRKCIRCATEFAWDMRLQLLLTPKEEMAGELHKPPWQFIYTLIRYIYPRQPALAAESHCNILSPPSVSLPLRTVGQNSSMVSLKRPPWKMGH